MSSESDSSGRPTTLRDVGIFGGNADPANPEPSRADRRAEYEASVTRLGDELEAAAKLVSWARRALENELFSGMGYKQQGISDRDLGKLRSLTSSLSAAVDAKVRYDKAAKDLTANMTPEEEFRAVCIYIRTLDLDRLVKLRTMIADLQLKIRRVNTNESHSGPEPD